MARQPHKLEITGGSYRPRNHADHAQRWAPALYAGLRQFDPAGRLHVPPCSWQATQEDAMAKMRIGYAERIGSHPSKGARKLVSALKRITRRSWRRSGKLYLDEAPKPPYFKYDFF